MDALSDRTPDPAVTLTIVYEAPQPARPVPSMQEAAERDLRNDLERAADSAHWARYYAAEDLLRAMAAQLEERR